MTITGWYVQKEIYRILKTDLGKSLQSEQKLTYNTCYCATSLILTDDYIEEPIAFVQMAVAVTFISS